MTFSIGSLFGPNVAPRELSDEEVFGAPAPQAAAKPRELSDEEVFGTGNAVVDDGSVVSRQAPTLGERFRANVQDAFRTGTLLGVGTDLAAQGAANRVSPELGQRVLEQQQFRDAQVADMPAWNDPNSSFTDKALAGAAALFGQLVGSIPSPESAITGPIRAGSALGSRIFQAGRNQAVINTATDPAVQGGRIAGDLQEEFDPVQTALAAPLGFLIGSGVEAGQNARALTGAFREWRAKRGAADPMAAPTADEVAQFEASPELQAFMASNGITDPADPRVATLTERLAARRAAEAEAAQRPINTDRLQVRAEKDAIADGDLDPAAAAAVNARREPVAPVIVPEATATPGVTAGVDLRGRFNAPVPVEQPRAPLSDAEAARQRADITAPRGVTPDNADPIFVGPEGTAGRRGETIPERTGMALPSPEGASRTPMSDAEALRARAAIDGGNQNQATGAERLVGNDGRVPQTPTDIEGQRQAGEAFRQADAQRGRAGADVRDTQPAGRPEGTSQRTVFLDDGFPVEILERRLVPDAKGNMVEVAKVRQYDPRTGEAVGDGVEYDVPVRQLKSSQYAPEPRRAQDFVEQSQSPRNPEQPRMAGPGEPARERAQTFRTTAEDPTVRGAEGPTSEAPGRGPSPRSPRPDQAEGAGPWRERPQSVDDLLREYEAARAREEAARARGEAPNRQGPRADDNKTTNQPRPQNAEGRWDVDDRGFVVSDKGGPIRFADQRQAGNWIMKSGHRAKTADQIFEIANHPSGKGFTVLERGRQNARPGAGEATPAPEAPAAPQGPQRLLAGPPRAPEPQAPTPTPEPPQRTRLRPAAGAVARFTEDTKRGVTTFQAYDRDGVPVGDPQVTGTAADARRVRKRLEMARDRAMRKARAEDVAGQSDAPLHHRVMDDIEDGRVKPSIAEITRRYGVSEAEAQAAIDRIVARPDSNVTRLGDGYRVREVNAEADDASFNFGRETYGIDPEQFQGRAFYDELERRMDAESPEARVARLDAESAVEYNPELNALFDEFPSTRNMLDDEKAAADGAEAIPFDDTPAQAQDGAAIPQDRGNSAADSRGSDADGPGTGGSREPAPDSAAVREPSADDGSARGAAARTERTAAGNQGVIPGAEQSARQAQAKRDAEGMRPKVAQKPADDGLFDTGARGQGTLYSNGVFDPNAWKRAFGWALPNVKEWTQSLDEFRKVVLAKTANAGAAGEHLARSVFYAADSEMRAIADRVGSPKAREAMRSFLDQWHARAGEARGAGITYDEATTGRSTARLNQLSKILEGLSDAELAQAVKQVQSPNTARAGTKIGDAAIGITKFLREELKYLKEAGVDIGEVRSGYYPRIIDEQSVIRDRPGFLAAAESAYKKHLGMGSKEAKEAAQEWLSRILYGNIDSHMPPPGGAAEANFIKGRILPKAADETLRKFLVQDPKHALTSYVTHAVRRAEFVRRMGPEGEKWAALTDTLRKNGAEDAINALQSYVSTVAGTRPSGLPSKVLTASSWIRTWTALSLLEKATISSLAEVIMPAVRASAGGGPVNMAANVGRSLGATVADLVGKTKGAAERRALAEDLGLISAHMDPVMAASRWAGGDVTSLKQNYLLQKFFQRTGLEAWTNATRVAAVGVGQTFMRRLALDADKSPGITRTLLAELGVPKDRAADFAKWLAKTNDGKPAPEAMTGEFGQMYRTAITRFVDQSILRPSAATKPRWATHPLGAVAFQIMSYTSTFHKNVINRPFRLAAQADLTALERAKLFFPTVVGMSMLVPLQALIGEGRDALLGDPSKRQEEEGTQKILKAVSRSGLTGGFDPLLNAATSVKYGKDFATTAAGPGLGRIGQGIDASVALINKNSPNTNAAERKIAQTFYDMGIEPAVNVLLSAAPGGSLAAAAATQVIGAGQTREAFVSAVAGPKENRQGARTSDGRSGGSGGREEGRSGR